MKDVLYLGSKSVSRQNLLKQAEIPFKILRHDSDECVVDTYLNFDDYVLAIAQEKMEHVILPDIATVQKETGKSEIFVLTADTLLISKFSRKVFGKPKDINDAKRMIRIQREEPVIIVTACVLEKKKYENDIWKTDIRKEWCVSVEAEFYIEEELLDDYFRKVPKSLHSAGAAIIEGYGCNFLKSFRGSYAAALGLPVFELRHALKKMGFWE